jgi:hypothetical protein
MGGRLPTLAELGARFARALLENSQLPPRRHGVGQVCRGLAWMLLSLAGAAGLFGVISLVSRFLPEPAPRQWWIEQIGLRIGGCLVVLLFYPIVWAAMKVYIGTFQIITGVRFRDLDLWWSSLPWWGKLLVLPPLALSSMLFVVALLLGIIAGIGRALRW